MIYLLVLATGTLGTAFAQDKTPLSNADKTFEPPPNTITRRFLFDLKNGNRMQIELSDVDGLHYFLNIDSLLMVFMHDMEPFKDSLSDELSVKRIDYKIDSSGRKEIRIQRSKPKGDSYVIEKGELAALKLEQDTINIVSIYIRTRTGGPQHHIALYDYRRVSFFLNRVNELPAFISTGLNNKIRDLAVNISMPWTHYKSGEWHLDRDPSISANRPRGVSASLNGDFVHPILDVSIQNYKDYFVPSFGLGLAADFNNETNLVNGSFKKYVVGFSWEPHFFFQNNQGKLETVRNDFLNLEFGFGPKNDIKPKNRNLTVFWLGYLIKRSGDYFDKNTFRFGVGRISLFDDRIQVSPGMYFNNFFRGVTPTVRVTF